MATRAKEKNRVAMNGGHSTATREKEMRFQQKMELELELELVTIHVDCSKVGGVFCIL